MMGGGTFILLKVGRYGPKSAKQTESYLAILLKILWIARFRAAVLSCNGGKHMQWLCCDFCWVWLICRESSALLFKSQF
jgi:hypothetical protein